MASSQGSTLWFAPLIVFCALLPRSCTAHGDPLSVSYYDRTCPNAQEIVHSVMEWKVATQPSMAPAVLRLFFHDCFVNVRVTIISLVYFALLDTWMTMSMYGHI
jgi:peroxidase